MRLTQRTLKYMVYKAGSRFLALDPNADQQQLIQDIQKYSDEVYAIDDVVRDKRNNMKLNDFVSSVSREIESVIKLLHEQVGEWTTLQMLSDKYPSIQEAIQTKWVKWDIDSEIKRSKDAIEKWTKISNAVNTLWNTTV